VVACGHAFKAAKELKAAGYVSVQSVLLPSLLLSGHARPYSHARYAVAQKWKLAESTCGQYDVHVHANTQTHNMSKGSAWPDVMLTINSLAGHPGITNDDRDAHTP